MAESEDGAVEADRIAVGRALGGEIDPGHAAGAGMDLDEDLLAEVGAHVVGKNPGEQVGGAAGGEGHDQLHRPGRERFRAGRRCPQQRETECRNEPASHGASPRRFLACSAPTDGTIGSGAGQQELVRHPATRQYDCSAEVPARGKRPAGFAGGMWGVCMKTILVPTEHNAAMASALDTALLLAQKFGSCIEGFPLRPAVADLVAMDPDSGLTMVAVKENDAEMVRQAEDLFRAFMTRIRCR